MLIVYDDNSFEEEQYFDDNEDNSFSQWFDDSGKWYHKGHLSLVEKYFTAVVEKMTMTEDQVIDEDSANRNPDEMVEGAEETEANWSFNPDGHPALALGNEMRSCIEVLSKLYFHYISLFICTLVHAMV